MDYITSYLLTYCYINKIDKIYELINYNEEHNSKEYENDLIYILKNKIKIKPQIMEYLENKNYDIFSEFIIIKNSQILKKKYFMRFKEKIKYVIICNGTECIECKSFFYCSNLKYLYMSNTINYIGHSCFFMTTSLKYIKLSNKIKSLSNYIFKKSGIKNIDIPKNVITLESYCFYDSKLEIINIPSNVQYILRDSFGICKNLKEINLNEGIITIEDYTIYNIYKNRMNDLPKSIKYFETMFLINFYI